MKTKTKTAPKAKKFTQSQEPTDPNYWRERAIEDAENLLAWLQADAADHPNDEIAEEVQDAFYGLEANVELFVKHS